MNEPKPIRCVWRDGSFVPYGPSLEYCNNIFGEGEAVILERNEEHSDRSRGHYFARLHEAWQQLPERLMSEYPSETRMRTTALIHTGYCDTRDVICTTENEAIAVMAAVKMVNEYCIVERRENVVRIYSAKSQSKKSMNKAEFQASKDAVLQFVADLIGTTPKQLKEHA